MSGRRGETLHNDSGETAANYGTKLQLLMAAHSGMQGTRLVHVLVQYERLDRLFERIKFG